MSVLTKRNILSAISQLFDPLGILGPIIILGKLMIQNLWKISLDWDDLVPEDIAHQWITFRDQLTVVGQIKIPRKMISDELNELEIHGFSDASEHAYGACVYVRSRIGTDYVTQLVCAKSRVAPLKRISLPRLELCGAVILAKLVDKLKHSLSCNVSKIYYWSDSMVTLHWIRNTSTPWKTFVANRVSIIQTLTNIEDWRHVGSIDNPADIISRGSLPSDLIHSCLWFHGPSWLKHDETLWPSEKIINNNEQQAQAESKRVIVNVTVKPSNFDLCSRFSNLNTLVCTFSYMLRFINNSRKGENRIFGDRTPSETYKAFLKLISLIQNETFERDISDLRSKRGLSRKSSLLPLNPFLDDTGLLRVGGRLSQANYHYDKKFPILLPHNHKLTILLFENEHKKLLHCGAQTLLASLRERFWPLAGKSTAKLVTRNCTKCFKFRPREYQYQMGDLPSSRVTPARPFATCGTDFAGPFLLKDRMTRGAKLVKSYICVFICFVTKAVHLELVADLTTKSFLAAFTRFVSRRGMCSDIYSDNGTNFVGASNELSKLYEFIRDNHSQINDYICKKNITWHFSPPSSPHMGGLWESAVKSMKTHLYKIIGQQHLSFDEFITVLAQVEACMNSRPLSPLSEDPSDPNPLTAGHFLTGGPLHAIPERDLSDVQPTTLKRWERVQGITQQFWKRWVKECIAQMQTRKKWRSKTNTQITVGDLVLIKQESTPPLQWPMGRISDVHPGVDGIIRVVSIKTSKGTLKRSTKRICKLPMD